MRRREPPPIAVWALEHLTSGDRDEGLAGDMLEAFQSGRSHSWYWRQTFAACAVSWFESLRARVSLLLFALLWSMAAPGWNAVCIMVDIDDRLGRFSSIIGPFWLLLYLGVWIVLHAIFLWAGLLVFSVFFLSHCGSIDPRKFKRALLLAALIIAPAYFVMFVGVDLYWYSTFERFQVRGSPLNQAADLRMLADVIRIPYFLALIGALWGTVRRPRRDRGAWLDPGAADFAAGTEDYTTAFAPWSFVARHFFALMAAAGLLNAAIAGLLLCQLPEQHSPAFASVAARAVLYVLAGVLAGAGGTYLYWKNPASPFSAKEPLPFPLFALTCAGGWVWVPAIVILSKQLSPASPLVAIIGTLVFASGLRRVSYSVHTPAARRVAVPGHSDADLFVASLDAAPVEMYGYMIALGLYAGAAAFFLHSYFAAAVLLVLTASVFAWNNTIPQDRDFDQAREQKRAAWRLAWIAILAMAVTTWTLLDGVAHRNLLAAAALGSSPSVGDSLKKNAAGPSSGHATELGIGGYESVILWPYPDKQPALPPMAAQRGLFQPGTKEPLVIRFTGQYWYFQPPHKIPGPAAHKVNGTPLDFDIQSRNSVPLVMDAHQYLSAALPIAGCGEIAVDIENRDNDAGEISLGVLLSDGALTKASTLYLGEQPVASTLPEHFAFKRTPIFETLHFSIPAHANLRKFSEVTVLFLPDIEHEIRAPKIGVRQLEIYPR